MEAKILLRGHRGLIFGAKQGLDAGVDVESGIVFIDEGSKRFQERAIGLQKCTALLDVSHDQVELGHSDVL
jgi:hypothetical protein